MIKTKVRKTLRLSSAVLGISLAAMVCLGVITITKATRADSTFVWGMSSEMNILDPHATCSWYTTNAIHNMFEGLVMLDLTKPEATRASLKPALAESWTVSDDGLTYRFKLREGVKFHDGTSFDAQAAKWNYDRFMDKDAPQFYDQAAGFMGYYTRWINSVEQTGSFELTITLNEPNFEWLQMGVQACGMPMMMSPKSVETWGNTDVSLHPVGTGAFKFVEREQNIKVVFEKFDGYWGEPAKIDRLIFRPLPDQASRLAAIRAGEVHMINEAPWEELESLKEEGFTISTNRNIPSIWLVFFNHKDPIMQDVRVRKAINMAVNREGIAEEILKNTGRAEYGMLSPGTYAYQDGYKPFNYDPEGAKKLLAEAGYNDDNPLEINFDIYEYGYNEVWEKWIQRDLKKVGIKVKLNKIEGITYLGKWLKGMVPDVHMNEIGWGWSIPFWTQMMARCDSQPPGGFNISWYCNPEVDKLFNEALKTKDEQKAAELYRKANEIMMGQDYAFMPKFVYYNPLVLSPSVKTFMNAQENWYDFSVVEIE